MKIEFRVKTFDGKTRVLKEEIEYRQRVLLELCRAISQNMDLSNLEALIIAENYEEELYDFQKKMGLQIGITNDGIMTGVAQMVTYQVDGKIKHSIFVHKNIVYSLVDDIRVEEVERTNEKDAVILFKSFRVMGCNIIAHELYHVNDFNIRNNISWINSLDKYDNNVQKLLIQSSIDLWSEYYACRASSHYKLSTEIDSFIESIEKITDECENKIKEIRRAYNERSIGLDDFVFEFNNNIYRVLRTYAYLSGDLYKLKGDERIKKVEELCKKIDRQHFKDFIVEVDSQFDKLFLGYPDWNDAKIFEGICEVSLKYMNAFGVYLSNVENGIYYSIPWDFRF